MSAEEIRELWSRFLAGEELPPEAQKGLVDALDADPELRGLLLENLQLDGILHSMSTTRREGDTFVRNLTDCLGPERDATRFIRKVESRLNENPPPTWTPPATGRKNKKDTTRVFRRRSATSASGETAWKPALIAAAAFIAIILMVLSSSNQTRRPVAPKPDPTFAKEFPPSFEPGKRPEDVTPPQQTRELPPNPGDRTPVAPPLPPRKSELPEKTQVSEENRRRIDDELKKGILPPRTPGAPTSPSTTADAAVPPAVVERVEGNVFIAKTKSDKQRAKKDDVVQVGWDIETYPSSTARVRYPDGTWVEVGPSSSFRETAPTSTKGRQVFLAYGTVESQITRQSPDRPMVFTTPTAEAIIVGTTIRLTASHDLKLGRTTLEVKEGKVQLIRSLDKKLVEVTTGHFAVVSPAVEMTPRKSFPDEVLVKFGPADVQLQSGWVLDTGEEFDATRGYGWIGPKQGEAVPGLFWRDGSGNKLPKYRGRFAVRRGVPAGTDPLKATDVTTGWAGVTETWYMPIPNGRYLISVCCGDLTYEQGPHHVWVEGVQIIDQKKNRVGESVEMKDVLVEVKDGQLTMKVGGNPGTKVSADGSTDTCINYLLIKRVRK